MSGFAEIPRVVPQAFPIVRAIDFADVRSALAEGWGDFRRAPVMGLCFGGFYALGGMLIVATVAAFGMSYLAYPLAAGFVLIGPFVAAGLYEISRRRERGEKADFVATLTIWRHSAGNIGIFAAVLLGHGRPHGGGVP